MHYDKRLSIKIQKGSYTFISRNLLQLLYIFTCSFVIDPKVLFGAVFGCHGKKKRENISLESLQWIIYFKTQSHWLSPEHLSHSSFSPKQPC